MRTTGLNLLWSLSGLNWLHSDSIVVIVQAEMSAWLQRRTFESHDNSRFFMQTNEHTGISESSVCIYHVRLTFPAASLHLTCPYLA